MLRSFLIIAIALNSTITMSQSLTFNQAVNNLYFGVDITKSSGALVDSLMKISKLHHNDTVIQQSNLNLNLHAGVDGKAWSSRHKFTFTQSPLTGLKISSGLIEVRLVETHKTKKVEITDDLFWYIDFNNKEESLLFFNELKKIFRPLSTKHKYEILKDGEQIIQFSTRKSGDIGIKDILITLGKSQQSKKYQISILLMNDFMFE